MTKLPLAEALPLSNKLSIFAQWLHVAARAATCNILLSNFRLPTALPTTRTLGSQTDPDLQLSADCSLRPEDYTAARQSDTPRRKIWQNNLVDRIVAINADKPSILPTSCGNTKKRATRVQVRRGVLDRRDRRDKSKKQSASDGAGRRRQNPPAFLLIVRRLPCAPARIRALAD